YMLAAVDAEKLGDKGKLDVFAKERKLHPIGVRRWMNFFEERRKMEHDPIFEPWFKFVALTNYESDAKGILAKLHEESVNPLIASGFGEEPPASLKEVAEVYKKAFSEVEKAWTDAKKEKA